MYDFNVGQIAGLNATTAGLLAGLAFSTLLLYVSRQQLPGHKDVHTGVATTLLSAFLALLICAINYGTIAGLPPVKPGSWQGLTLTMAQTPSFAMGIMQLFMAVAIASYANEHMTDARKVCRWVIVVIAPVLTIGEMTLAGFSFVQLDCQGCAFTEMSWKQAFPATWSIVLMVSALAACLGFMLLPQQSKARSSRVYAMPSYVMIAVTVGSFVLYMVISMSDIGSRPTDTSLMAGITATSIIMTYFSFLCAQAMRHVPAEEIITPDNSPM